MKFLIAALLGGTALAPAVINPARHECLPVMAEIERGEPTIMNQEGELKAVEWLVSCGAEEGDDLFTLRIEADNEEFAPAVEASATVVTYTPGHP